ncbi:MAG: GTP-binding protein, partial [bacterium]
DLLDIRGFNLNEKLEIDPEFLADEAAETAEKQLACGPDCGHDHDHHEHHDHHHAHHSDDISSFVFRSERAFNSAQLDEFLSSIVQVFGPRMLRYKGVLLMEGADRKVLFQGVHQLMGTDIGGKWAEDEIRGSKMVFIGQNLPKETIITGLEHCLV